MPPALNPITAITHDNAGREAERLAIKYKLMRGDVFAFLRATCNLFHQRLPNMPVLHKAPKLWICGDLHLQNFGTFRGYNGLTYFDINDFDEAALAPFSFDVVRLLSSLQVSAQSSKVAAKYVRAATTEMLDCYVDAIANGKARWIERATSAGPVKSLLRGLKSRTRQGFLDERAPFKGKQRRILVDKKHALPISDAEEAKVFALMRQLGKDNGAKEFYTPVDAARRIAGTGSLGLERYAILVAGHGGDDGHVLLDMKASRNSALGLNPDAKKQHAERVFWAQRTIQAMPPAYLQAVQWKGGSYLIKEMQPQADRLNLLPLWTVAGKLAAAVGNIGEVAAWAHLRACGQHGGVQVEDVQAFVQAATFKRDILAAADQMTAQVLADWQSFSVAYDAGKLKPRKT